MVDAGAFFPPENDGIVGMGSNNNIRGVTPGNINKSGNITPGGPTNISGNSVGLTTPQQHLQHQQQQGTLTSTTTPIQAAPPQSMSRQSSYGNSNRFNSSYVEYILLVTAPGIGIGPSQYMRNKNKRRGSVDFNVSNQTNHSPSPGVLLLFYFFVFFFFVTCVCMCVSVTLCDSLWHM